VTDQFIKVFEVDGRQVAVIDRGESDEAPGHFTYELVTKIDGLLCRLTAPIPEACSTAFFEDFGQQRAEEFYRTMQKLSS
jgi:hypothetical protein